MMAVDTLIADVAGNDEAWMAHIAEDDDGGFGISPAASEASFAFA